MQLGAEPDVLWIVVDDSGADYPITVDPDLASNEDIIRPTDSDTSDTRFGFASDGVGDVNADGYDDILVGAYNNYGYAYLYYGSTVGIATAAEQRIDAPLAAADARFGSAVSGAGATNGDEVADPPVAGAAVPPCVPDAGRAAGMHSARSH